MTFNEIVRIAVNMAAMPEGERQPEEVIRKAINDAYIELSNIDKIERKVEFSQLEPAVGYYYEHELPSDFKYESKVLLQKPNSKLKPFHTWKIDSKHLIVPSTYVGNIVTLHYFAVPQPLKEDSDVLELSAEAQNIIAYYAAGMGALNYNKNDLGDYFMNLYMAKKAQLTNTPLADTTIANIKGW